MALVATLGIALVGTLDGHLIVRMAPHLSVTDWSARVIGSLVVIGCAAALVKRGPTRWLWVPILFWLGSAVCGLPPDGTSAARPSQWVPVAEGLFMAAVTVSGIPNELCAWARNCIAMGAAAAMLALFGYVQWHNASAISALLPTGFPLSRFWPYASGAVQIGASCVLVRPSLRAIALLLIALLYLSWLPMIHVPRLLVSPADGAEWQFALTALALAGA